MRISLEYEALLEVERLIIQHFKEDHVKVYLWFLTPNPMLGEVSPVEMVRNGRANKLLRVVRNLLDEDVP